jgi:hypothetical protein
MKKTKKFDYMWFSVDGANEELVFDAKKYTKEQALEIAKNEFPLGYGEGFEQFEVVERYVRYYPSAPSWCGCDSGSCYTYCPKDSRGSFKVLVITSNEKV